MLPVGSARQHLRRPAGGLICHEPGVAPKTQMRFRRVGIFPASACGAISPPVGTKEANPIRHLIDESLEMTH